MKEALIKEQLSRVIKQERIGNAYIFQSEILTRAMDLAYFLIMLERCYDKKACVKCQKCSLVAESRDPYIYSVVKPQEEIVIGEIRQITNQLQLLPLNDKRRFVLLCAKALNVYAQNSLLKHLEEPPKNTTFIICTRSLASILPTILSRCNKFSLNRNDKQELLIEYVLSKLEDSSDEYGSDISELLDQYEKLLKIRDVEGLLLEVTKKKDLGYQRRVVLSIIWVIEWYIKQSRRYEYDTINMILNAITAIDLNVNPQLVMIDLLNDLFISKANIVV